MKSLREFISEAEQSKKAIGHFNIASIGQLKAVVTVAKQLELPVIIGVSEGERNFIGVRQAVALIKSISEVGLPIFINADHTKSLEKVKEAAEAGYNSILFDASHAPFEENIKQTKQAVEIIKSVNPDILVEGELGYIGSSSKILEELPKDAVISSEDLPKPERAAQFVKETGIDMLAPAVGNIHGMLKNVANPNLDIKRISEIKKVVGRPLVLHGGSGIKDEDFTAAINAGVSIVHISTEIRAAWRQALDQSLKDKPQEVAPYKIMADVVAAMEKVVEKRLKLFSKIN